MKKRLISGIVALCLICTFFPPPVYAAGSRSNQDIPIDEVYTASSISDAIDVYEQALAKHQNTIQIVLANSISYQNLWDELKSLLEKHVRDYSNFNVDTLNIDISKHVATLYTSFYTTPEEEKFLDSLYAQLHEQVQHMSDYEKIKFMHDYICESITYDDETLNNHANKRSAYDGLISGKTVCCGYALAFQRFMEQEQIPCYIICGTSPEGPHAWNVVNLNGQWYHLDTTWDDSDSGYDYSYFLLGTDKLPFSYVYKDMSFQLSPTSYMEVHK